MKKWEGRADYCDFCGRELKLDDTFIDGMTIYDHWNLMCETCHIMLGRGLGLGRGQSYNSETKEKIDGA